MTFDETKIEFMKRFKTIKEIYRNESKKGIWTTVILVCGARGVIKLAEGETDDFEKSILWAYAKATKNTIMYYNQYTMKLNNCISAPTHHTKSYANAVQDMCSSPHMSLSISSMHR